MIKGVDDSDARTRRASCSFRLLIFERIFALFHVNIAVLHYCKDLFSFLLISISFYAFISIRLSYTTLRNKITSVVFYVINLIQITIDLFKFVTYSLDIASLNFNFFRNRKIKDIKYIIKYLNISEAQECYRNKKKSKLIQILYFFFYAGVI